MLGKKLNKNSLDQTDDNTPSKKKMLRLHVNQIDDLDSSVQRIDSSVQGIDSTVQGIDSSVPRLDSDVSKYFHQQRERASDEDIIVQKILYSQRVLNTSLRCFFSMENPIAFTYNPLEYAYESNKLYIKMYCTGPKKLIFIGMNPGPFGMCQTGVPFGDVTCVRDWLRIEAEVTKPEIECSQRPIEGFACTKKEQSGDRFWNFFRKICVHPENFFKNAFIYNYCPLAFMKNSGVNVTPSEIKGPEKKELEGKCDATFADLIKLLQPEIIIGVGKYAEKRTIAVLRKLNNKDIKVLYMPHPSPRSINNQNWPEKAEKFLIDSDLMKYFQTI